MTTERFVPILIAALLAVVNLALSPVAFGATWMVTSYGDDPDDVTTLRGALHAAHDGDTIDLTGLTNIYGLTDTIYLTHGATQILRELPVIYSVTIQGPGPDKLAISGNDFSTVFRVYTGANVTISGLTIRDGKGTQVLDAGGNALGLGGGIVNSGTLTLTNCAIVGNVADGGGGIVNEPGKTLTITNCTVSNNYALQDFLGGGAIWNSPARLVDPPSFTPGAVTIVDTTIDYNNYDDKGSFAQAIRNEGTLTITGGEVSFNEGGAILNDGTLTLTGVTLEANDADAIANEGSATVTGSTLAGNKDAAIRNHGTLRLTNSTIVGSLPDCSPFSGCDFSGHGIINSGLTIVINSTIAGNSGFGLTADFGVEYFLKNTILAHNARGNCDSKLTIESEGHSISDDASCATYLSADNDFAPGTDPFLDPIGLKDNGGPTPTIALTPSSVAIDAIPPADCDVATDQRGIARPQGKGCDIGAYEAVVTAESIKGDVRYFFSIGAIKQDEGTSLLKKLDAAAAYRATGDCADANATYQAFINELRAQSGKKVRAQAAAVMIADAQYIIAHCP